MTVIGKRCHNPARTPLKKKNERANEHSKNLRNIDTTQYLKKHMDRLGRKNFFPMKIVGSWNCQPANVVDAATIGSFKRRLVKQRRSP